MADSRLTIPHSYGSVPLCWRKFDTVGRKDIDQTVAPPTHNRLLAALSAADCTSLLSATEPAELAQGAVLYDADEAIDLLYFPAGAVLSLSVPMQDRDTEVAMVGREGFAGAFACLGEIRSPMRATVQHPGGAYTVPLQLLQTSMVENQAACDAIRSYIASLIKMLAQSSFCRASHSIEQQAARWLLMFSDRVEATTFHVTHEALARLLGVRRASITEFAGRLHEQRILDYHLGRVTITHRAGLERVVCECYRAMCEYERDRH